MKTKALRSGGVSFRLLFLLGGAVLLVGGARPGFDPRTFDRVEFDAQAVETAAESGRPVVLHFFGEDHRLLLEPSDVRSSRFEAVAGRPGEERAILRRAARTYKGRLESEPDSMVRLSIGARGIRGLIKSSEGWTFIEPAAAADGAPAAPGEHRVFTDGDIDPAAVGFCAEPVVLEPSTEEAEGAGSGGATGEARSLPAGDLRVLELAADADFEFHSTYKDGTLAEIEAIVNIVDGIYELELGISIEIVSVQIRDAEPDPYTSTNPSTLLGELRSHWNGNHGNIARDTVHLFTGKDLDGSTVGIAYLSVVCSTGSAYALSQDVSSDAIMPIVTSHEMGHNLSASHDTSGTTPRYIMYPSIGSSNLDEFSTVSKTAIGSFVGGASCLAIQEGDPPPEPEPPPPEPPPPRTGGGGGGGPVDPLLLVVILGATLGRLGARRREGSR